MSALQIIDKDGKVTATEKDAWSKIHDTTSTAEPNLLIDFIRAHQRKGCKPRWGSSIMKQTGNIVAECKPCGDKVIDTDLVAI